MRAVVQRVSRAHVSVDGEIVGKVGRGLLVLVGIAHADGQRDADYLVDKIVSLRIFDDRDGKMNLSLIDVDGGLLAVSQFTLYGDTRRGRRPSFVDAMPGEAARPIFEHFVTKASEKLPNVETGRFGAHMDVEIVNDGPVTIILDSETIV